MLWASFSLLVSLACFPSLFPWLVSLVCFAGLFPWRANDLTLPYAIPRTFVSPTTGSHRSIVVLCPLDVFLRAASGPEALRAHLKSEIDRWTPIIKKAGVSAD
jgi:hypothetical protein